MPSLATHGFALFLAVCALCAVATAALASAQQAVEVDRVMGVALVVVAAAQAVSLLFASTGLAQRAASLALTALAAVSAFAAPPVWKAGLAQIVFALSVAVAVATSPAWARGPRPVEDEGFPSMRTFGWLTPLCVLAQVLLGAGLRYNVLPVWPHVTGSLVFGALLLFAGMAALQSYNFHEPLKRSATAVLWATGLQMALGMGAFGVRTAKDPAAWAVYLTVAHVVVGAITLGATTAFALQIFYHVRETLLVREAAA